MSDLELTSTRVIKAPRERVFDAWTRPDILVKWWGPGEVICPEAYIDLRVGGEYRIANRDPDGSVAWITGTFEEVVRPERLVYNWTVSFVAHAATLVTVLFNIHPEGTEVVLTHQRFADAEVRDMHAVGWAGCIDKLEALLAA